MQDDTGVLESNEIQRFELLRNELIELERRVERSAKRSESEEVLLLSKTFNVFHNDINMNPVF